jgi:hypothetical protein
MIFEKKGNLHLYKFDDFEEYLDRAENEKWKKKGPGVHYHSGWGSPDHKEQMKRARMGWKDVIGDINHWRDLVVKDISSQLPKPQLAFDKVGSFWDVGRVVENDPDCWQTEEESMEIDRQDKGNLVRIVINTATSADVRSKTHTARCGAVLAICQLLEMMGFYTQFEITTAIGVKNAKKLEFRTIAKRPNQVFNIAALAYWSSEYMERHIDFAICETMDECLVGSGITYGWPIFTHDPGDICFDRGASADVNWLDEQSAKNYIIKQLEKQGVVLEKTPTKIGMYGG